MHQSPVIKGYRFSVYGILADMRFGITGLLASPTCIGPKMTKKILSTNDQDVQDVLRQGANHDIYKYRLQHRKR
jgi:hypothetical protein